LYQLSDNIIALSTPAGTSALALIRLTGKDVQHIVADFFSKDISNALQASIHYGFLSDEGKTIDEVMVSVFWAPRSFTGENMLEISCHGSPIITQRIITTLIKDKRLRMAEAGEFSLRAFQNKKMDLVKAESISDLIAAASIAAQQIAANQLRNGFSSTLLDMRQSLVDFAALLELELDFSEEDVEFAKRDDLKKLCNELIANATMLSGSFKFGNAIKNGIQTAIIGKPNAGKSTLLNALLNEDRAIVSPIAGTTRDTIEEKFTINGVLFQLIDTAGLRDETQDEIEKIGIERTQKAMRQANVLILVLDATDKNAIDFYKQIKMQCIDKLGFITLINKADLVDEKTLASIVNGLENGLAISANSKKIAVLLTELEKISEKLNHEAAQPMITNLRHYEALNNACQSLSKVVEGIENGAYLELVAADLKNALYHLGSISGGNIGADEVLTSVFSRFCIGK